jgi:hypothetical protein
MNQGESAPPPPPPLAPPPGTGGVAGVLAGRLGGWGIVGDTDGSSGACSKVVVVVGRLGASGIMGESDATGRFVGTEGNSLAADVKAIVTTAPVDETQRMAAFPVSAT